MENPAFLDSDQSVYESVPGSPHTMSQRRQHHLPAIHNAHAHNPRGGGGGGGVGGSQHVTHVHNGRVLGVTGVPGTIVQVAGVPGGTPGGVHSATTTTALYPDPSLPPLYSAHLNGPPHSHVPSHAEYLYSCEAPRGHDHVYQCPGHRGDQFDHRDHHLEHRQPRHLQQPREHHHLDHQPLDSREHHFNQPREHHLDGREHHLDGREHHLDGRDHHLDPALDQRPDYHYGGSDYSSTEPIYAQPHLYPREGSSGTPTLGYNNARASLRAASAASSSHLSSAGTPAKYLVRSDSCGNSTSSSTLPTVSALLSREAAHTPPTPAHNTTPSLRSSVRHGKGGGGGGGSGGVTSTPAKLKRQGLFRAWKVKFLRGEGGRRRACLLFTALLLVLLLVLGALAAVLYLTLGGGLSAFVGESPRLIQVTETGSSVVEGEFRITNLNFWPGLEDPHSEEFRVMAQAIENELDTLFLGSVWSREYNHSQVISLAKGSLLVRAQLVLNTADVAAAQKLGTAFLRGLHNRHGHEWLGQYSVNITSIRFTEVVVDTPPSSSSSSTTTTTTTQPIPTTVVGVEESSTLMAESSHPISHLNVGWGEWSPWTRCSPCSPQYDQIRTRHCRMDAGRGVLINSIEPCLPSALGGGQPQGSGGDMETRPCQCHHIDNEDNPSTTTTTTTTTTTITTSTSAPWKVEEQPQKEERVDEMMSERLCDSCLPGEVCVGLQGEPYPTCRTALDAGDRTGCGGLCAIDSEVCQALGSRAFQCHSASLCLHDEWRCADGLCIPHIKRCDGHMNCYDQSDEQHCQCSIDQFQCGNNTSCLPVSSKCDGKMDCWDGSDEANCTTLCPNLDTQFTCRSSQCIPKQQFCDGLADCRDGSDEPFGCSGRCQTNEYQCRNGRCIPTSSVCDGGNTCGDFSDEQDCNRPLFTVTSGTRTPILNLSTSTSWSGMPVLNFSTSTEHLTTARTDHIWLLHLGGQTTKEVKTATEKVITSSDIISPVSARVSVEPGFNRDSTGEFVSEASDSGIERGWRRTANIMPSLEEYAKLASSKSQKRSVPAQFTQNVMLDDVGHPEVINSANNEEAQNS